MKTNTTVTIKNFDNTTINFKIGDYFQRASRFTSTLDVYILSRVDGKYCLVNVRDGGYFADPSPTIEGAFGTSSVGGVDKFEKVECVITVTNPLNDTPLVGQYYKDISRYGNDSIYLLTKTHDRDANFYSLNRIDNGNPYSNMVKNIMDVFGGDRKDFVLIDKVDITVR